MDGVGALYLYVLAGIAGYVLIARVPSVLHLSLLSGANFVHGVVLCGAMLALARADGAAERVIGFVAVALAAANVVGGYLVTDRLLTLFERRTAGRGVGRHRAGDPDADRSGTGGANADVPGVRAGDDGARARGASGEAITGKGAGDRDGHGGPSGGDGDA